MGEDTEGGVGELCSIDEAGVGKFVENDGVTFSNKRGDGAHGGGVAICEAEGGFCFL